MKLYSLPEEEKFRENLLTLLQSRFQRSGKRGELRPQSSAPQLQTGWVSDRLDHQSFLIWSANWGVYQHANVVLGEGIFTEMLICRRLQCWAVVVPQIVLMRFKSNIYNVNFTFSFWFSSKNQKWFWCCFSHSAHMDGNSAHLDHCSESMHLANTFFAGESSQGKRVNLTRENGWHFLNCQTWPQGPHGPRQWGEGGGEQPWSSS